jgi:uncharacterized cysteine cluster protein YcgN (CxxCxxCC family)
MVGLQEHVDSRKQWRIYIALQEIRITDWLPESCVFRKNKHGGCVKTLNRTMKERPSLQTQRSTAARAENLQHD